MRCTLLALLLPLYAHSQWTATNGPRTPVDVQALVASNGVVLAAAPCGIFSSEDAGMHWRPIDGRAAEHAVLFQGAFYVAEPGLRKLVYTNGQWTSLPYNTLSEVNDLVATDELLAACSHMGFLFSPDGATWTTNNAGLPRDSVYNPWTSSYVHFVNLYALAYDAGQLYAGTAKGVYRSSAVDAPWSLSGTGLPDGVVDALVSDGNALYAAVANVIYRSTDQGSAWTAVFTLPSEVRVQRLVVLDTMVYACTDGAGLVRTANGGDDWSYLNEGLVGTVTNDVLLEDGTLLLAASDDVYRDGAPWSASGQGLVCSTVYDLEAIGNTVVATVPRGVHSTVDGGSTWSEGTTAFPMQATWNTVAVQGVFVNSHVPVGIGAPECYNLRAPATGAPWSNVSTLVNYGDPYALRSNGQRVVAFTDAYVFLSNDAGGSWSDIAPSPELLCGNFTDGGWYGDTLFLVDCGSARVVRSTDLGDTWYPANAGLPLADAYLFRAAQGVLYVATYQGLYRSLDGGDGWVFAGNGLPVSSGGPEGAITDLVATADMLFLCTTTGVYVADPAATEWTNINEGLPPLLPELWAGALHMVDGTLYFGTNAFGVYRRELDEVVLAVPALGTSLPTAWPNPATDHVRLGSGDWIAMSAVDATGRVHVLRERSAGCYDVSTLAGGSYLLTATDRKGNTVRSRVIVQ